MKDRIAIIASIHSSGGEAQAAADKLNEGWWIYHDRFTYFVKCWADKNPDVEDVTPDWL